MTTETVTKKCECPKPVYPDNLPLPIHEYQGTGFCGYCKGTITFPIAREEYDGEDPVEAFLFNMKRRSDILGSTELVLMMLLRLEDTLKNLIDEVKNGNVHRSTAKGSDKRKSSK